MSTSRVLDGPDGVRSDLLGVVRTALDQAGPHGVQPLVRGTGPWTVAAEPDLAVRALLPVLENARTYGRGQVAVTVSMDRTGTDEDDDPFVAVEVTDDGDGFTAQDCDTVFEPGVPWQRRRRP